MYNKIIHIFVLIFVFTSCENPIARKPVSHASKSYIAESVALNKVINEAQEQAIKKYIKKDSLSSYIISKNGFWYKKNITTSTLKPKASVGDEVVFTYEISDLNDRKIYSKEELGVMNYLVDKEDLTSGLQNGIKLMREGEEFLFLFPSFKAFGFVGDKRKIGINQPLIFKVQLIKIKTK